MADRFQRQLRELHGDDFTVEELDPTDAAAGRRYRVVKRDAFNDWLRGQPKAVQLGVGILALIAMLFCVAGLITSLVLVGSGMLTLWRVWLGH